MNNDYCSNYQSEQENLLTALRKLKGDQDSRSFAIEALFRSLVVDDSNEAEGSKFDFVMDDGIDMISSAILKDDCSTFHIIQGFKIIFAIAEDSKCHWQSVFGAIGEFDGIIRLLEHHHMNVSILSQVIFMMSKLCECGVHCFHPSQVLRWLCFFDLLLEGVEENLTNVELFRSFCLYIGVRQYENFPPQEVHERVLACVLLGMDAHRAISNCQLVGQAALRLPFQVVDTTGDSRFGSMISSSSLSSTRLLGAPPDTTTVGKKEGVMGVRRKVYSFRRCAPAA
eukprot:scaffold3502_cov111-Cylindrotheca_fusiformis.AAC.2